MCKKKDRISGLFFAPVFRSPATSTFTGTRWSRVGIFHQETLATFVVDKINGGAAHKFQGGLVYNDLHAFAFESRVGPARLVLQSHSIFKTGASTAGNVDPQAIGLIQVALFEQVAHNSGGGGGDGYYLTLHQSCH